MRYRHKEVGEPFDKAQSFGCDVLDRGKNVVIFPHDQTVQSYITHNEGAFHQQWNPLRHARERHNTDVTQMIF